MNNMTTNKTTCSHSFQRLGLFSPIHSLQNLTFARCIPLAIAVTLLVGCTSHSNDNTSDSTSELSAGNVLQSERVYNDNILGIVLIIPPLIGGPSDFGSGVLVSKNPKLVVTNSHVVKGNTGQVELMFAARDGNGQLITDWSFYSNNEEVLRQLGFRTRGRVIHDDPKVDLAILQLDYLPEQAKPINMLIEDCSALKEKDPVHLLSAYSQIGPQIGLWRWMGGHFRECGEDFVVTSMRGSSGNSGGAVLDEQGQLVGIHSRSDRHMYSLEIPSSRILDAVSRMQRASILSIHNATSYQINFFLRQNSSEDWQLQTIQAGEREIYPWWRRDGMIEPEIAFDYLMSEENAYRQCGLETYQRYFIPEGLQDSVSVEYDAREFGFRFDADNSAITIHDLEERGWICEG